MKLPTRHAFDGRRLPCSSPALIACGLARSIHHIHAACACACPPPKSAMHGSRPDHQIIGAGRRQHLPVREPHHQVARAGGRAESMIEQRQSSSLASRGTRRRDDDARRLRVRASLLGKSGGRAETRRWVSVPRRRRGLDCAARDACAGRMGCLPCVVVDERGSKQGGPGGRRRKAGAGIVLADLGSNLHPLTIAKF